MVGLIYMVGTSNQSVPGMVTIYIYIYIYIYGLYSNLQSMGGNSQWC